MSTRGGIAHRADAVAAFGERTLRTAIAHGALRRVRRQWLALAVAADDLVAAAEAGGVVTCVSLARRRGWWMPEGIDERLHLHLSPHQASPRGRVPASTVLHWTKPLAPGPLRSLQASVEDALAHVARCVDPETALVIWESAIRVEGLSVEALRCIRWPNVAATACAAQVQGLSDSGLETLFVARIRPWGLSLRQQVVIAGQRVDLLVGERLVIQIDGFAHHSSAAQRSRDVAHDAELRLRGYSVLRFTYAQVIHAWPTVERTLARAVAGGLHL